MNFADIHLHRCRRSIASFRAQTILWAEHLCKAVKLKNLLFLNEQVPRYLHRANNAPLDKNAINLAEIPVFERCFKYGTSPDYIPKKVKETPEMIVSVKLYA